MLHITCTLMLITGFRTRDMYAFNLIKSMTRIRIIETFASVPRSDVLANLEIPNFAPKSPERRLSCS